MLLTTVFGALVSYHSLYVHAFFNVLGLWELHGLTSESQASVVLRSGVVEPGVALPVAMPTILHWICGNVKVFCASEPRAPALHNAHVHNLIHERYLNDLLDGEHCLCTTWRISTVFGIFLTVSICLCAVGCTAGVFTALSNCRNLNLKHLCSLVDLFA